MDLQGVINTAATLNTLSVIMVILSVAILATIVLGYKSRFAPALLSVLFLSYQAIKIFYIRDEYRRTFD